MHANPIICPPHSATELLELLARGAPVRRNPCFRAIARAISQAGSKSDQLRRLPGQLVELFEAFLRFSESGGTSDGELAALEQGLGLQHRLRSVYLDIREHYSGSAAVEAIERLQRIREKNGRASEAARPAGSRAHPSSIPGSRRATRPSATRCLTRG